MSVNKHLTACNIYTLLWCVMHLKGVFYDSDSISVVAYAGAMLISIYCFFQVLAGHFSKSSNIIKALNILTSMFIIYGVINIVFFQPIITSWNIIPTDFYLKNILNSILPIYAYFFFAIKGQMDEKWVRNWVILFIIIAICRYFYNERHLLETVRYYEDEITNNNGYLFVALLPGIVFWKNKPVFQYLLIAICIAFTLSSMKRGAILAGGACIIVFFLFSVNKKMTGGQKLIALILGFALVYFAATYYGQLVTSSEYFNQRIEQTFSGNSSSRNNLFLTFFEMILNSNPFNLLLGYGADGTIRNGPNYAHNDWLEIGIDQGLIGIFVFLYFCITMIKFCRSTKENQIYYVAMMVFFTGFIIKTFYSMSINAMEIYSTSVFGYIIAEKYFESSHFNKCYENPVHY